MERYSPILVLITGIATFIGLLGLGLALLRFVRLKLPEPWRQVCALLLAVGVSSLVVQLLGMVGLASRSVLTAMWWGMVLLGGWAAARWAWPVLPRPCTACRGWAILPATVGGIALTLNLLVAIAPSTKHDELFYHMLIPSRIVTDGALRFYREPWPGAIWPQMIYQVSLAPLHAIGYPDAGNVVSWGLALSLLWFAWYQLKESEQPAWWVYVWPAALVVGLYTAVWQVTGGAHAFGDLGMAAGMIVFCRRRQLLATMSRTALAGLSSIVLLAAASSKVSLIPLSSIVLLLQSCLLFRSADRREKWWIVLAAVGPWAVLFTPLMAWTWWNSGSPFGPLLGGIFRSSVYRGEVLRETLAATLRSQASHFEYAKYALANYSPLLWLGVLGALLTSRSLTRATRGAVAFFFVLQGVLIYFFLPHDVRFFGGMFYGAVIVFALSPPNRIPGSLAPRGAVLASASVFLLPWLAVQSYYAAQFLPVSLGLEEKPRFYDRYVAFSRDYRVLDRALPKNSVLVIRGRSNATYAPRPVLMDPADLPPDKRVFLFAANASGGAPVGGYPGYHLGGTVYENPQAVARTYRTPGKKPIFRPIRVVELVRD